MAQGVGLAMDTSFLKKLDEVDKKLSELEKKGNKIAANFSDAFKKMSQQGLEPYLKSLGDQKRALEALSKVRLGNNASQAMKDLKNHAKQTAKEIDSVIKAVEMASSKQMNHSFTQIFANKGNKSLNEMNVLMQQMQQAQMRLNLNTKKGQKEYTELAVKIRRVKAEIDNTIGASKRLSESHKGLINIGDQLARKFALVFSVSQIQGYINKLAQVRGEFELQQRALQSILQDKDAADKLWQQTVDLAVRSPYRVGELVKYTKQLAAYRIETDKLHETTKRLADVSSGLGVDMNRIILAYGQIRAAEYLRGTELRQLTEAGIPMLDELAKHFTALEGRAVSAGDVFGRISKRMVAFEDVAAVFKKMTDAGGVFYNMQEIQAETLKGQISNLHDSIDLMLNDIGKANDVTLKSLIKYARNLVDNWEEISFGIGKAIIAYAAIKSSMWVYSKGMNNAANTTLWFNSTLKAKIGSTMADVKTMTLQEARILGVTKAQFALGKATMFLQGALRGVGILLKSAMPFLLIGGVVELWRSMTEASRAAKRLKDELDGIISADVSTLDKNTDAFKDLVARLDDANKGSQEHSDIIKKLNSQYGEYLNFVVDESTTMQQLADAYDEVVKRMKEKQSLATFEKGMATIAESYGNNLKEAKDEFYDLFNAGAIKSTDNNFISITASKKEIDDIYSLVQQKSRELKSDELDSLAEQRKIINDIIKEYYGKEYFLSVDETQGILLMDILLKKKKQEEELQKEIDAQYKETLKSREANLAKESLHIEYAQKRRDIEKTAHTEFEKAAKLYALQTEEQLAIIDLKLRFNIISEEEAKIQKDKIINWATELNKSINEAIKINLGDLFSEEDLSKVLITKELQNSKSTQEYIQKIKTGWEQQNATIAEQISLKSKGLKIDEKQLADAERLEKLYRLTADAIGLEIKYTERLSEESRNAINSLLPDKYKISLEEAYSGIDKILSGLKTKEKEHLAVIQQLNEQKKNGLPIDEEKLRIAEESYWWVKKTQDLVDPSAKTAIAEQKVLEINAKLEEKYKINSIDKAKDEVTLLQEANSEKEKAIAYEAQLNAQRAKGITVTDKALEQAKMEVEQTTLRWQLLGGVEKEKSKSSRANSLYDERIKVVDDMRKKYEEVIQKFGEDTAIEQAFDAYKDAFVKAFEGVSFIPSNVDQMTAEEFVEQVLAFPDKNEIVDFLDTLAEEPMKAFEKIKVELAKGKYVFEMKIEAKAEENKQIAEQIQDMFGDYETSLELEKLNIPPDFAKNFFGVGIIDLSDIRKKIESEIARAEATGGEKEFIEQRKQELKKVEELERKAQEERLKKYVKYLQKAQSEAVRIKINELNQLDEIEKTFQLKENVATSKDFGMTKEQWSKYNKLVEAKKEINEENLKSIGLSDELIAKVIKYNNQMKISADLAKKGVRKETEDKLNENQWKLFKESSPYKLAFSDIESQSTATLNIIEEGIKSIENSLSKLDVTQMKELADLKQKVFDIKVSHNPFKALETSLKDIQDLKDKGLTKDTLLKQIVGDEKKIAEAQHKIDLIDIALNKGRKGVDAVDKKDLIFYNELLGKTQKQLNGLRTEQEGFITKNKEAKATAEQNLDTYAKADQAAKEAFAQAQQATEMMQKAYGDLSNILSAVGVEMEDSDDAIQNIGFGLLDLGMQIAQIAIQANIMGVAFQTAMGPIGWISTALSAVSTVLTGIFAAHDNSLERDIQNTIEYVEKLERAYQRLEKRIESAYSAGWINSNYADASQNIQSQINSYESMIAFEEEKKKTDIDKIREWENEIEDLTEQLSELEQQRIEALGGFGSEANYKSAAEEFASAWFDAYREVGDGISGLEDTFDEFINNVVKKQLLIRGSQQLLQPLLEMIDNAVNDGMVTTTEMAGINKEWNDKTKDALNEYYKAIYDMYDGMIAGAGELSDLQRGIQNITEPQAAAIEAYLNSVRAFVSDSNATLKNIYNAINVSTSTPIMNELKTQTELIRSINENIGSVIGRGRNGIEGAYIKVLAH